VTCKFCDRASSGICQRCGGNYCLLHGAVHKYTDMRFCTKCYDRMRLGLLFVAGVLMMVGIGVFRVLYVGGAGGTSVIVALPLVGLAGFLLWMITRPFPY